MKEKTVRSRVIIILSGSFILSCCKIRDRELLEMMNLLERVIVKKYFYTKRKGKEIVLFF